VKNKPLIVMMLCFGIMTSLHAQPLTTAALSNGDTRTTTARIDPDEGQDKTLSQNGKVDVSLDYSYLNAGTSGDNISFPLGARISASYKLKDKLGLVLDASYHTKKDMDFRISRFFVMGGAQYTLYEKAVKDGIGLMLLGRLLAGLAADRQKYLLGGGGSDADKAKALAIAVGLGLVYPVNSSFLLELIPDYIHTRFNDESQSNWRVSLGARFRF
jgi:hypothetical protein